MKNLLLVISIVVASFISTSATEGQPSSSSSYEYCEVDNQTFEFIKDSLKSEPNLEFQYWNTQYADIDYLSLTTELNMIKSGITPDKEGAIMHNSWVKFANDWENKEVLGTKIYIHVSVTEIDGSTITTIEFISDELALSQLGLEKERELFE